MYDEQPNGKLFVLLTALVIEILGTVMKIFVLFIAVYLLIMIFPGLGPFFATHFFWKVVLLWLSINMISYTVKKALA